VGTGNVAPDFIQAMHPGDNLYTSCILAIDGKTGKLLAYIQPVKHDYHDWDIATAPAIVTTRGGHKLAIAAGKDGLVYGIEREVSGSSSAEEPKALRSLYQAVATTRSSRQRISLGSVRGRKAARSGTGQRIHRSATSFMCRKSTGALRSSSHRSAP